MEEVFVEKKQTVKPGLNIGVLLNKKATKGEVGLEIEVEGQKLPHGDEMPPGWGYHEDHSLRGDENAEYVLKSPISFDKVPDAVDKLWKVFEKKKTVLDDSNRTSVHVHLNCQDFFLNRLTSFLGIYFGLEEILTEYCGEYRVGNLFCLRAIDAPGIVLWIKRFIRTDGEINIPDSMHYAGLNTNALKKFGSLEIRTLRGTSDPSVIKTWVAILEKLYKISDDFPDPRDVCTMISSHGGPLVFFDTMLGDMSSVVRTGVNMTDQEIKDSIYRGIRLAQDICYCRDWNLYRPMPLKPDPFDRSLKKMAKKMLNTENIPIDPNGPGPNVIQSSINDSFSQYLLHNNVTLQSATNFAQLYPTATIEHEEEEYLESLEFPTWNADDEIPPDEE